MFRLQPNPGALPGPHFVFSTRQTSKPHTVSTPPHTHPHPQSTAKYYNPVLHGRNPENVCLKKVHVCVMAQCRRDVRTWEDRMSFVGTVVGFWASFQTFTFLHSVHWHMLVGEHWCTCRWRNCNNGRSSQPGSARNSCLCSACASLRHRAVCATLRSRENCAGEVKSSLLK